MTRIAVWFLLLALADAHGQAVLYSSAPLQGTISSVTADAAGNLYVTGYLKSNIRQICGYGFFGIPFICDHAFVAKIDPGGTRVIYNTVLAGSGEDRGASIAVDAAGNAYVLGTTFSADFPVTAGAAQSKNSGPPLIPSGSSVASAGGDLFIAKLDPGGQLVYATFLGGPDSEQAGQIRVDSAGNVYVSGSSGTQFPVTQGAYLSSGSGVAAKIDSAGTQVVWSTYLIAGNAGGKAYIDIDAAGGVYAAVLASVTKLNADGKSAAWTYSGPQDDVATGLALDSQGAAWVVGRDPGGSGFLSKLSPDGSRAVFSSALPPNSFGVVPSIAVDAAGRAYVAGVASKITPTQNALMPSPCTGLVPLSLTAFNPDGGVFYSSYLPASESQSIAVPSIAAGTPGQVFTSAGSSLTATDLNAPPAPFLACAVNAASFLGGLYGAVAPGELISLFGSNLGPSAGASLQLDANGNVSTALAGTRVLFNGVPAPLLYVGAGQINTVVPFGVPPGKTAQIAIETGGRAFPILPVRIADVVPGVFTLPVPANQAAALNQDGTVNSPQNPAARGSVISLFATGLGPFDPPLADAEVAPVPPSTLRFPIQVYFGDGVLPGKVTFAGSAPGLVAGAVQINVEVPSGLPAGVNLSAVPVFVLVNYPYDTSAQPGVTVAVR